MLKMEKLKMKQIDLFKFKKLVDSNSSFIVKFKNESCHVCKELEPEYKQVSETFPSLEFYDIDIDEEEELADMFVDSGVPTLYYINGKKFKELEYPEDGFNVKSLTKEIKKHLK